MARTYKPTWHEGIESRFEESWWPYAIVTIADQMIYSQNIGTLKAMARDKAINRKTEVPVVVHIAPGNEYTIVFTPEGKQRFGR